MTMVPPKSIDDHGFSASVLAKKENEIKKQFQQNRERFQNLLKNDLYRDGELSEEALADYRKQCGFESVESDELVGKLQAGVSQQFFEAKTSYLLVFERIMSKEGLRTSAEDKLELKNLASRLQLGANAVSKIEEDYLSGDGQLCEPEPPAPSSTVSQVLTIPALAAIDSEVLDAPEVPPVLPTEQPELAMDRGSGSATKEPEVISTVEATVPVAPPAVPPQVSSPEPKSALSLSYRLKVGLLLGVVGVLGIWGLAALLRPERMQLDPVSEYQDDVLNQSQSFGFEYVFNNVFAWRGRVKQIELEYQKGNVNARATLTSLIEAFEANQETRDSLGSAGTNLLNEMKALQNRWETEQRNNENTLKEVREAIAAGRWSEASTKIRLLRLNGQPVVVLQNGRLAKGGAIDVNSPYWQQTLKALVDQINAGLEDPILPPPGDPSPQSEPWTEPYYPPSPSPRNPPAPDPVPAEPAPAPPEPAPPEPAPPEPAPPGTRHSDR